MVYQYRNTKKQLATRKPHLTIFYHCNTLCSFDCFATVVLNHGQGTLPHRPLHHSKTQSYMKQMLFCHLNIKIISKHILKEVQFPQPKQCTIISEIPQNQHIDLHCFIPNIVKSNDPWSKTPHLWYFSNNINTSRPQSRLPIGAEAGQKASAAFLHRVQLGINGGLLRLVGWKKVSLYGLRYLFLLNSRLCEWWNPNV